MKTKFNKELECWGVWLIERAEWLRGSNGKVARYHSKQEAQARIDLAEDWQ